MTLVDRLRAKRNKELEAITARYENIGQVYGDLLTRNSASPALGWCRARLADGIPEWLVATALLNAHLNLAAERLGPQRLEELVRRRGPWALHDTSIRPLLDTKRAWDMDTESLDATLDAGAFTVLMRHGAEGRRGRGYPAGAFLRVARGIGLLALDVPHAPLIPQTVEPT